MNRVQGAGGVVLSPDNKVLIVQYKDGSWTYPKGHIEPGEDLQVTACREVLEEAGVEAVVEDHLGVSHYVNAKGIPREIHWFVMRTPSEQVVLEDTFQDGGFYEASEALQRLTFEDDQKLLQQALGLQER